MPVVFVAASQLPTPFALFTMHGFLDEATGREHVVLSLGDVADGAPVLGRLHSECLTGDALFSQRCCRPLPGKGAASCCTCGRKVGGLAC